MPEWIKVCDIKSLKNGDLLDFDFGDKTFLIAKAGNKIYATDRICTHAYADLSTGFMNENEKTIYEANRICLMLYAILSKDFITKMKKTIHVHYTCQFLN